MDRIATGVPGLDTILRGGLLQGGITMLMGRPGGGKTTLANQLCFHHAAKGGKAVYVTLLTESHGRMLALLESFGFFDPQRVGTDVHYLSGLSHLEKSGLGGLNEVLRGTIRRTGATLVVLDGVPTAGALAASEIDLKRFVHELQVIAEMLGATVLLLTGANHPDAHYAERTMVDGLIHLTSADFDLRSVRELEVVKHRGSEQIAGRHMYRITSQGIHVHPRTEALGLLPARPLTKRSTKVPTGIAGLDDMLEGGLRSGSVTLVKGPAGVGKTLLAISVLTAGGPDERGVYFSLHESPERLADKAAGVGLSLRAALERERVTMLWHPDPEEYADQHAERLLETIRRTKARRLVIDGLGSLMATLVYPNRAAAFFGALFHELRALDVAALLTMEGRDIASDEPPLPVSGLSALVDNILHLRLVEVASHTHRLLCVLKAGEQQHDRSLRELTVTSRGVVVHESSASASTLLQGVLRSSAPTVVPNPGAQDAPADSPPPEPPK